MPATRPPLAHRALDTDRSIGLLLPCNVVVRRDGDRTVVQALDPNTMVALIELDALRPVAEQATRRLDAAFASLTEAWCGPIAATRRFRLCWMGREG